jgi:hypothetical protein
MARARGSVRCVSSCCLRPVTWRAASRVTDSADAMTFNRMGTTGVARFSDPATALSE